LTFFNDKTLDYRFDNQALAYYFSLHSPKNTDIRPMKNLFPHYGIGHFINEPKNPTQFEVTRFEEMGELDIEDPHKHTFYEILWVDEGISSQVIDYQEYIIEPKTLFFISPNQLHHFEEYQPLKGGSVFFTEDFFLFNQQDKDTLFEMTFLDNFYTHPYLKTDDKTWLEIRQTIEMLIAEKRRTDASTGIIQSLLTILLAQIQRSFNAENKQNAPKKYIILYKKLKKLIDEHYKEDLTASDYAAKLFITQHHLNLVAKEVTGKTTSELIRSRSILEAKRLLTFTDMSVSEIATELGFFDLSYFGKVFKAEANTSPLAFKKAMSDKYRNL
jgi:AraC family transcriptional regulator, transcriptional activator of pobA